jgi:hypothetical protein
VIKRIHVNQLIIKANRKSGERVPPLTAKTSRSNFKGPRPRSPARAGIVCRPDKPLPCGAAVWVETYAPVTLTEADGEQGLVQ